MKIGMVGLGKMGFNMSRRLLQGGHEVVATDLNDARVAALVEERGSGVADLDALVEALEQPRVVWIMVPSGGPTESTVDALVAIDFYEWRAGELTKRLRGLGEDGLLSGQARIVEMGSGPVGVLGFLPGSRRVAVDPLNGFYASNARLTELRNPEIEYVEAPGEAVPLPSGEWDLVIMENCIDHVQDVDAVMKEIDRLLGPRGLLYLTVNAPATSSRSCAPASSSGCAPCSLRNPR
jgi:hypothetical protein